MNALVTAFEIASRHLQVRSVWLIKKTMDNRGFQSWHRDFYLDTNVIATILVNVGVCDLRDDNVLSVFSPQRPNPISRIHPHNSIEEAITILEKYGTVTDVQGDGSCGYHVTKLLLIKLHLISKNMSVKELRKGILKFIESNIDKFVGSTDDGNDCAFQYVWGYVDKSLRQKQLSQKEIRKKFMKTAVMKGIWNSRTDYSKYVKEVHWMEASHLLPVIVYMYKIAMLVLIDNRPFDNGRVFQTYIYTYNETIPSVDLQVHDGIMEHICPSGAACLVFIDDDNHFQFFEYSEVHEES